MVLIKRLINILGILFELRTLTFTCRVTGSKKGLNSMNQKTIIIGHFRVDEQKIENRSCIINIIPFVLS